MFNVAAYEEALRRERVARGLELAITFDWDPLRHPRDLTGRWRKVLIKDGELRSIFSRKTPELPDNTQDLHTFRDDKGKWRYTDERKAFHDELIQAMLGEHKQQTRPSILFTAGGAGSGKTTAIEDHLQSLPPDDHVWIDPDKIKEQIPEYRRLVEEEDPRAAALVHDESIDIAHKLLHAALSGKYNTVMDGTGASPMFIDRINHALDDEYGVEVAYFSTDVDTALARVAKRKQETGRGVNESVARDMHRSASRIFEDVYDLGVALKLYDTTGDKPELIAEAEGGAELEIHDNDALDRFLEKANAKSSWDLQREAEKAKQSQVKVTPKNQGQQLQMPVKTEADLKREIRQRETAITMMSVSLKSVKGARAKALRKQIEQATAILHRRRDELKALQT